MSSEANQTGQTLVRIPTPLRSLTGGASEVTVSGSTVGEVLNTLDAQHAGFAEKVLEDGKTLRPFVNIFVGSDNVKTLQGLDTQVANGAVISIIPAVAGGRDER